MGKTSKPAVHTQMLTFRCSPEERIELGKLANRHHKTISDTLRALIAQAAAQRTTKSAASVATPTPNQAA